MNAYAGATPILLLRLQIGKRTSALTTTGASQMHSTAAMREAKVEKENERWVRLREEFQTCEYLNSGAYNKIPTKRGNLEDTAVARQPAP